MIDQDQSTLITMTTFSCENMACNSGEAPRLRIRRVVPRVANDHHARSTDVRQSLRQSLRQSSS
jgi:hypothetical protein